MSWLVSSEFSRRQETIVLHACLNIFLIFLSCRTHILVSHQNVMKLNLDLDFEVHLALNNAHFDRTKCVLTRGSTYHSSSNYIRLLCRTGRLCKIAISLDLLTSFFLKGDSLRKLSQIFFTIKICW